MNIELDNLTLKEFLRLKEINKNEDKYESRIEFYSDILQVCLNKTVDEIESMDIHLFKQMANDFNLSNLTFSTLENEIKIDGQVYVTSASNNEFSFKVKEIQQLEKVIRNENAEGEIAAIIWRERGDDGKPVSDFSVEGIEKRKQIFLNNLKLKYMLPYLEKLAEYLGQKK